MRRWSAGAVIVAAVVTGAPHEAAGDDTKQACIDANEHAQVARKAGRLREARTDLVSCAADRCPQAVRSDCARMLTDVTAALPTIVVEARDAAGADTAEVRVRVDGAVVAERLTGTEIEVDPGSHTMRLELRDGTAREQSVVVAEGDKRRRVAVDFSGGVRGGTEVVGSGTATPAAPSSTAHGSAVPWVLGGIGVAAGAAFTYFAIAGYSKENDLASHCAPSCRDDQVSPIRTSYLLADITLGVAVVSLAAAAFVFWREGAHASSDAALRIQVGPVPGGGVVAAAAGW